MTARTDDTPLVSVIIPTIAVNDFFQEALDSVLAQDYPSIEVVVVLDGAPDPRRPAWAQDPRIKWVVCPERQGTPRALNRGIEESNGELLARLDADDLALPGRFSRQVEYLLSHPEVDCVGTGVRAITEAGAILNISRPPSEPEEVALRLLLHNCMSHSSVMYRKSIIHRLGGYSTDMLRMQDYELFLRMASMGKIANLPAVLVSYRVHPGQHSRKTSPWAKYTWIILRRRLQLALALDQSFAKQLWRNSIWFGAQVLRHYHLRRPRYAIPTLVERYL